MDDLIIPQYYSEGIISTADQKSWADNIMGDKE